jgi:elongation factor G
MLNFEPEEKEKGATLSASIASAEWKKKKLTILDTPGDANFFLDALYCLTAADCGGLVISAVDGVQVQTEIAWQHAEDHAIPRFIYITKMDRERADYEGTIEDIRSILTTNIAPLQIPIGAEESFEGVVDLLRMKALRYAPDGTGKVTESEIEGDLAERAAAAREQLVDAVAATDDELTEKYLEEGDLSEQDLMKGLRTGISTGAVVPLLCGSGLRNQAVTPICDMLVDVFPSPLDRPEIAVKGPDGETTIKADPSSPFAGQVFKTTVDQFIGSLTLLRVWSGTLKPDSTYINVTREGKERFGKLLGLMTNKQEEMTEAVPGDIVAVAKLKDTSNGDSLCDDKRKISFAELPSIAPLISFVLKPQSKGDASKIGPALQQLCKEDPALSVSRDPEAEELLVSGLGEDHIRITVKKLERKFNVNVELLPPKVPYRETITRKVMNVEGKHKKQTGGHGQFGVAYVHLEPNRGESGSWEYEFVNQIVGGSIPKNWIPSVEKGLKAAMDRGIIAGFPVIGVRVTLYDGKYHDVDSSDMSFQMAGSKAWKAGGPQGNPVILEPIMVMEIVVPEENMGDIMGDISGRRGRVQGSETKGKKVVIKASAPMAEVLYYANDLKSITGGRGSFSMHFSHYDPVPSHLTDKVIAESGRKQEDEE